MRSASPEIIIDQLTSLPKDPADFAAAQPRDTKLRLEGGANLLRAAQISGVRRFILQSSGFFLRTTGGLADESSSFLVNASPVIGDGAAVWSWIHTEDAALGTVGTLDVPPGVYNIVDSNPCPVSVWLPAFAASIGAPPAPQVSETEALHLAGPDAVFYGTRLVGATNEKAKRVLGFRPRRLEWLTSQAWQNA